MLKYISRKEAIKVQFLKDLLSTTAWEMEIPPAYGAFHISFVLIGFLVCFSLAYLLRNLSEKGNKILFLSVGAFLLVTEIYKQLMYKLVISPDELYRWGVFPFHLCSIPLYLCLIIPFLKKGILKQTMYDFLMTYNLLSGFVAFFEPSGLLHQHVTMTAHSLVWHMLLVFLGAYVALSKRGGVEKKNLKRATVMWLVLCVTAFTINCIHWNVSEGAINNFFVGPRNSSLIVFKQISEAFGWYVSTALYIPATALGAGVVFTIIKLLRKTKGKPPQETATRKATTV